VIFAIIVTFSLINESKAQLYSNFTNTFTPSSDTRVGIGTSMPTTSLFVKPPTYTTTSDKRSPFQVEFYDNPPPPPGGTTLPLYKSAIFVKWDGLIGIHTDNPLEKFHVNSNSLFTGNMTVGSNNWTSLILDGTTDNNWMLNAHNDGERFHIRSLVSGSYLYRMTILRSTGYVGLNNTDPQSQLHVNGDAIIEGNLTIVGSLGSTPGSNEIKLNANTGQIRAREIVVDLAVIPDYVFSQDYDLMPLLDVKTFINKNKHLPNVKSEAEFKEAGAISLTEMNMVLLEKVEELTLYVLDLQEQINLLKLNKR